MKEQWMACSGCGKERRTNGMFIMTEHNEYDSELGEMIRCDGSGRPGFRPEDRYQIDTRALGLRQQVYDD